MEQVMKKIPAVLLAGIMAVAFAFAIGVVTAQEAYADSYDLWVGGTQVTSKNAADVFNDGKVKFEPASGDDPAKLTLNGYECTNCPAGSIDTYLGVIDYQGSDALTIELNGTNEVTAGSGVYNGLRSLGSAAVTITGNGQLSATGVSGSYPDPDGISIIGNLTIESGTVTAIGGNTTSTSLSAYSAGITCSGTLTINGGSVTATGGEARSSRGITALTNINGGTVTATAAEANFSYGIMGATTIGKGITKVEVTGSRYAFHSDFSVKNYIPGTGWSDTAGTQGETGIDVNEEGGKLEFKKVVFEPEKYPLWVGGTQITSGNAEDVFNDGKVKFEPASSDSPAKLTLNGYECTNCPAGGGVYVGVIDYEGKGNLTIELKGTNVVTAGSGLFCGLCIHSDVAVTITGSGQLSATSPSGVSINTHGIYIIGDLKIESGTVTAKGGNATSTEYIVNSNGIRCTGTLTIDGGSVTATGGEARYSRGISAGEININGGTVTATGTGETSSYGIYGNTAIGKGITRVKVAGNTKAFLDSVKNYVPGTGWSNVEGTEGETAIPVNKEGGYLDFKKVIFEPASEPEPTPKPTPKPTPTPEPTPSIDKTAAKIALDAGVKGTSNDGNVTATWGKVNGATSYVIFAAYCDDKTKYEKIKAVSGDVSKVKITKLYGKKLNPKKHVKYYVVAYQTVKGKKVKVAKSITAHVAYSKSKKYTNPKKVKVKKSSYTLKKGKKAKIKAKLVLQKKGKKTLHHEKKFRYASSNTNVAKVSKKGKIKAVGKGECTVYVYAVNGCAKAIKVKVK